MGLKQRGDYRGRATDSGKRGETQCIPGVARPQARPQMNRAPEAPTQQQAFEAAKRGERSDGISNGAISGLAACRPAKPLSNPATPAIALLNAHECEVSQHVPPAASITSPAALHVSRLAR
jgi:hypothetical protein